MNPLYVPSLVSLNGKLLPSSHASISLRDRGFRYGDGVFETIPIVAGVPYLWEAHMARLHAGMQALHFTADLQHVSDHSAQLIMHHGVQEGVARIWVTRGEGASGYLPTPHAPPTILLEVTSTPLQLTQQDPSPARLCMSAWRRIPPVCLPTYAKLMQGVNSTLARMEADAAGYDDALMLSVNGEVAETSSGNLFWLHGETLCTPELSTGALAGTMRARLMQIWQGDVQEASVHLEALGGISALMMTNALRGAVPIISIHTEHKTLHFPASTALAHQCQSLITHDIEAFSKK
jgi:branched-chain amino acid aminotransferase